MSTQEMNDILMTSESKINAAAQENAYMSVEEMDDFLMKEVLSESTTSPGEQPLPINSVQVCFISCQIV